MYNNNLNNNNHFLNFILWQQLFNYMCTWRKRHSSDSYTSDNYISFVYRINVLGLVNYLVVIAIKTEWL